MALLFAVDPWLTACQFGAADSSAGAPARPAGDHGDLALASCRDRLEAFAAGAHRRRRAGLLLTSGPLAWGMLPLVLIFAAIYVWPGGDRAQPPRQVASFVWFGIALAVGRRSVLRPEAVGALSTSLRRGLPHLQAPAPIRRHGPSCAWWSTSRCWSSSVPSVLRSLTLDARRRDQSSLALLAWLGWHGGC